MLLDAAKGLARVLRPLPSYDWSLEAARLESLYAEMLLARGASQAEMLEATECAEIGIEIIERLGGLTSGHCRVFSELVLMGTVAEKALGNWDSGLEFLRGMSSFIQRSETASKSDVVELTRQEAMMLQDGRHHLGLVDDLHRYRKERPREAFRSAKRVLEFAMNSGMTTVTPGLFRMARRLFRSAAAELTPLGRVSFVKNAGQFYLQVGERDRGVALLGAAAGYASEFELHGQLRQINVLLRGAEDDGPRLETFKVPA